MKVQGILLTLVLSTPFLAGWADAQNIDPNSVVTALGGTTSYHVENADSPAERIVECTNMCAQRRVVVAGRSGQKPEDNLFGFHNLRLSPDASTLYFETEAWATSNAIHAVNLKTGAVRYVTSGSLACVVGNGEYQGDVMAAQHRYFVQGGSYDPLYLFTPQGKEVGIVALDSGDAPKLCGAMSGGGNAQAESRHKRFGGGCTSVADCAK
jgi:hypothetical protein